MLCDSCKRGLTVNSSYNFLLDKLWNYIWISLILSMGNVLVLDLFVDASLLFLTQELVRNSGGEKEECLLLCCCRKCSLNSSVLHSASRCNSKNRNKRVI